MSLETIIYISNTEIRVLSGSSDEKDMMKISDFKSYTMEEGAMLNGVIINEASLKETLAKVVNDGYKKVKLVIDSGQVLVKPATIPALKPKQILQFVKDELSNVDNGKEDLVYDYAYIKPSEEIEKASEILCCGIERKILTSYIEVFKECGITMTGIDFSINALNKLTNELSELVNHTYVISIFDGNNMISVLFENNEYKFSYRSRVISSKESSAYISEITNNISQIVQFSKSQTSKAEIESAYFCNLDSGVREKVFTQINSLLSIKAESFPLPAAIVVDKNKLEFSFDEYVFLVGSLIRK